MPESLAWPRLWSYVLGDGWSPYSIQDHFRNGRSPYPLERTLMTTGLTDAMMHAAVHPGRPLPTPELEFAYKPRTFNSMRENGASWKIVTDAMPEPRGIDNSGD